MADEENPTPATKTEKPSRRLGFLRFASGVEFEPAKKGGSLRATPYPAKGAFCGEIIEWRRRTERSDGKSHPRNQLKIPTIRLGFYWFWVYKRGAKILNAE